MRQGGDEGYKKYAKMDPWEAKRKSCSGIFHNSDCIQTETIEVLCPRRLYSVFTLSDIDFSSIRMTKDKKNTITAFLLFLGKVFPKTFWHVLSMQFWIYTFFYGHRLKITFPQLLK